MLNCMSERRIRCGVLKRGGRSVLRRSEEGRKGEGGAKREAERKVETKEGASKVREAQGGGRRRSEGKGREAERKVGRKEGGKGEGGA